MRQLSIYEQADLLWNMPEGERNRHLAAMVPWLRKAMVTFIEIRRLRLRQAKED